MVHLAGAAMSPEPAARSPAEIAAAARRAARAVAHAGSAARRQALIEMSDAMAAAAPAILSANAVDVEAARVAGTTGALLDRLRLDDKRLGAMVRAVREIAELPDPVGATVREWTRPNGLRVARRRIPLGVILMIYEARPNVTSDAAALCLRAGNATILRGGSEALRTNRPRAAAIADRLS